MLTKRFLQNFGPEVKEKASIYVPAIGKVTIVMLLRNLVVCKPRIQGVYGKLTKCAATCAEQRKHLRGV